MRPAPRARGLRAALLLLALGTLGAQRPAGLGDVVEVRAFDHEDYARVVIELSHPARYETGVLSGPPRLYIDLEDTWIDPPQDTLRNEGPSPALVQVRGGQNTLTRARIVLELDRAERRHRVFQLDDPFRVVVDVFTESGPRASAPPPDEASFDSRPVRRIAIDPGHGGKDPGAIGHGRLYEKDVVLRVAKALARDLSARGFEPFLTRDGDEFLTLEQRTRLANRHRADLFVSIHANASPRASAHGVETYLLDTRYDRQTARVAARENGTTVEELGDLEHILASLRLGYTERFAARLARHVQDGLLDRLRDRHGATHDLGVKRGPFLVLFMAEMPAVLVELGFVTNRSEARRLRSEGFAEAAARGLARGIVRYRDEHEQSLVAFGER